MSCDAVQIGPETLIVDSGRVPEKGDRRFGCDKAMTSQGREFTDGYAVSSDDEGLALIQPAHDLSALVAQLSLGDLSVHRASVARCATGSHPVLNLRRHRGEESVTVNIGLASGIPSAETECIIWAASAG